MTKIPRILTYTSIAVSPIAGVFETRDEASKWNENQFAQVDRQQNQWWNFSALSWEIIWASTARVIDLLSHFQELEISPEEVIKKYQENIKNY